MPKRQKFVGLSLNKSAKEKLLSDHHTIADIKLNAKRQFILMGTREKDFFVDPDDKDELPEVIDDFDLVCRLLIINILRSVYSF